MSAFVVDTDCMDRVVRGFEIQSSGNCTRLGRDLFKLNIEAVRQRYGDPVDEMLPDGWTPSDYVYVEPPAVPGVPSDVDSLKAMHCLIYQCSEGDVPEQSLYRILVELSQALERRVLDHHKIADIHDLPAYQRAAW